MAGHPCDSVPGRRPLSTNNTSVNGSSSLRREVIQPIGNNTGVNVFNAESSNSNNDVGQDVSDTDDIPDAYYSDDFESDSEEEPNSPTPERDATKRTENFTEYLKGKSSYTFSQRDEIVSEVKLESPAKERTEEAHNGGPVAIKDKDLHVPNCADIKLFKEYYILTVDNKVVKKCNRFEKTLESFELKGAGRMCKLKQSERVAVVQMGFGIVCLDTRPKIKVVYRIRSDAQFGSVCNVVNYLNPGLGLPNPTHHYAATSTTRLKVSGRLDEQIYIVKPMKNISVGQHNRSTPYTSDLREHDIPDVSGICSIASVWRGGIHLIVGCKDSVVSVLYNQQTAVEVKWKIPLNHAATDVAYMAPNVLVCVQDEQRIMAIDFQTGDVKRTNMLEPKESKVLMPCQLSVHEDKILVKSYSNAYWRELKVFEYTKEQQQSLPTSRRERTIYQEPK